MTFHEQVVVHETTVPEGTASLFTSIKSTAESFAAWVQSCADYWAAANLYDSLYRHSDAELHRRGLSRATLAHDVFRSCDC
jgi:hypothetical protein